MVISVMLNYSKNGDQNNNALENIPKEASQIESDDMYSLNGRKNYNFQHQTQQLPIQDTYCK